MKLRFIIAMAALAIGLGGWYYVTSRPQPLPPPEARPFVWSVEMSDLVRIGIELPRQNLSESWQQHEDRYWYFTDPEGPQVDIHRWGGGIPLLLSGPGANRLIAEDPTPEQLAAFGLDKPQMVLHLGLIDGTELEIHIGDSTPDRISYYSKQAHRTKVFTVDTTWYEVIEQLVKDPPYPPGYKLLPQLDEK